MYARFLLAWLKEGELCMWKARIAGGCYRNNKSIQNKTKKERARLKKKIAGLIWLMMSSLMMSGFDDEGNTSQASGSGEMRAFWVDQFHAGAKDPSQVDQLLSDVKKANANTIFLQVRRRGDAYYSHSLEPRTEDPQLAPGYDSLADLIQKAHSMNPRIEVHAWFPIMPIWNKSTPPQNPQHVFNLHGPSQSGRAYWLSQTASGNILSGSDYVLDPGHPDAVDYSIEVMKHVALNYDVDGIHMDLIRYMGADWGYNPTSVSRFNARYGRTGSPDPQDATWKNWRREQVNHLVRKAYVELVKINPRLVVSAATIAWGNGPKTLAEYNQTQTMNSALQDWNRWLSEGWVDVAVPMNYFREHDAAQKSYYENWIEWEKNHQYERKISAGIGIYLNSVSNGLTQIRKAMAPSTTGKILWGTNLYSYAVTNKDNVSNSVFYSALSEPSPYDSGTPVYDEWVPVPELPWKTTPTKGHLFGHIFRSGGGVADEVPVQISGPVSKTLLTDGSGDAVAIDLPPGTYAVTVGSISRTVSVTAGKVTEFSATIP